MQNPTQAQAINNLARSQMPPLRQKKLYEANVLQANALKNMAIKAGLP